MCENDGLLVQIINKLQADALNLANAGAKADIANAQVSLRVFKLEARLEKLEAKLEQIDSDDFDDYVGIPHLREGDISTLDIPNVPIAWPPTFLNENGDPVSPSDLKPSEIMEALTGITVEKDEEREDEND